VRGVIASARIAFVGSHSSIGVYGDWSGSGPSTAIRRKLVKLSV
jgi:hypothetical protein